MSAKNLLADQVRAARNSLGLTQAKLAEKAKVPLRTLQDIEYGKNLNPSLDLLISLAEALDTTLDALTGRPGFAKAQVAGQMAQMARFERNWGDAAELLGAVARAKPVRRLAGLYILTRDERYLDALRDMLPPQAPLFQWLDQAP